MANETNSPNPLGFRSLVIDNVFIVVWHQVKPSAMTHLLAAARDASRVSREPLVYLAVIPDGAPTPDEAGRKALADATHELLELCGSMHCAIEGSGFKKSIIRGVAASIFLLSGKRGRMHVHDSVLEALRAAPGVTAARASAIADEVHRLSQLS